MELWIQEKVNLLYEELKHLRTVDSYLVKLSSLAYDVEDYCFGDLGKARDVFEKIIKHPRISSQLTTLSCYVDLVESQIHRDPRFKKLRNYSDLIKSVLAGMPCREVEKPLEVSREATFRIEKAEVEHVEEVRKRKFVKLRSEDLLKVITLFGIIVLIIAILLIFLATLR